DRGLWSIAVKNHPPPGCSLRSIAVADARQHGEIALVTVAIDRFAPNGRLRCNVEHDCQRRGRQELLNFPEPRRVKSLRLTVRNTRRRVPVADEDQSTVEPSLQIWFELVPISDIKQLHDVGVVLPFALQRTGDLLT